MELFNIGPLELIFILVIALIVLGPEEMVNTARKISNGIVKLIRSPLWASLMDTTQEIRSLPRKFLRESGLDENIKEISRMRRGHIPESFSIAGDKEQTPLSEEDLVKNDGESAEDPADIADDDLKEEES